MPTLSREIRLAARPRGAPTQSDFDLAEQEIPDPAEGELVVRNAFVSVDPYMRNRMNDVKSYVPPFAIGEPLTGGAVGQVIASRNERFAEGAWVVHDLGWREAALSDGRGMRAVDPALAPLSTTLGVLGMTGMTAFVGIVDIGDVQDGDTVFVSGAAGAVGSAVGQIASLLGAGRVIGSAGSAAKVALLTEKYGYDAAFNYKDGPVREQLAALVPEGVDVYFDNVGGDHLQAALDVMTDGGRLALCGAIAGYNSTEPPAGPDNLANVITRGLTIKGFTLGGYLHLAPEFTERMTGWFAAGKIAYDETVVDGIEHTVDAFLDMMRGANIGKMLVRVGAVPA